MKVLVTQQSKHLNWHERRQFLLPHLHYTKGDREEVKKKWQGLNLKENFRRGDAIFSSNCRDILYAKYRQHYYSNCVLLCINF